MVENVGVAAEIASLSLSVQKLFLLPVCVVAILSFPRRPTSGHVVSGISESGMVENVGVALAAEIASPSLSVQKLSLLPVVWPQQPYFEFPMSDNIGSECKSGVVENVGVAVVLTLLSLSVQELLLRLVSTCQFSVSKPPYWYFDIPGNDVILHSADLATIHFKLHLFIRSLL